jgi:hypothetical protein
MIKGALYGAFATFAALDFLFYLMALYMVLALPREYAGHGLSNFGISIVEIQTYGLDPLLRGMLLGFAYGAFAGAVLYFLRRLRAPLPVLVSKETRLKRAALATSVIGLLSFPFLIPACVFSVLAIVFGMRAVAKQKLSEGRSSKTTYVAIAIGAVGFLATVAFTVASVLYVKPYR